MVQQNVFLLSFRFRFGGIHPPGVGADTEQSLVDEIPVIFAGLWAGRVIHSHGVSVIGRFGIFELVDEPSLAVHVFVVRRSWLEERPDRNHQVEVLGVKLVDHGFRIKIVLVKDEFSLAVPPEPVLHDVVDGDVQIAILLGDSQDFVLRFVAVLALPESVGPFAEHGSLSGQLAVSGDDLVELGSVEKVVVDNVGHFRTDVQIICEPVVEPAARHVVPEDPVAFARYHQRDGDVAVVLNDVDRLAAIIPHAGLVLSEAIESLVRTVHVDKRFGAVGVFTVYPFGSHAPRGFLYQRVPVRIGVSDGAVFLRDSNLQRGSGESDGVVSGLHFPLRRGPTVFDHHEVRSLGERCRWGIKNPNDRFRADLQLQRASSHGEGDAVGLLLNLPDRVHRRPLGVGALHSQKADY